MKKNIGCILVVVIYVFVLTGCAGKKLDTQINGMTTNDKINPIGIDEQPYFSWKMQSVESEQEQTAYRVTVSETVNNEEYVWDSGKVDSDKSVAILYQGEPLEEEKKYFWKVQVWDGKNREFISETASFEMGKLQQTWEETQWITAPYIMKETKQVSKICYDFKMEKTETGFIWGAKQEEFGEYYRWSFNAEEENVTMSIANMEGERKEEVQNTILNEWDAETFVEQAHHVCIEVQEGEVLTYLDHTLVANSTLIEDCSIGEIGFWVVRGENNAWYDNIYIIDQEGNILYDEKFEGEEHIFQPYYLKVEEGWGRADSGFIVTPGSECPAPMFRKTFETLNGKILDRARLYISALGIFDLYVNGKDVNEYYGAPGQSVYSEEVYYSTYDITEEIQEGTNGIGIMLGHGRYDRAKGKWGEKTALCAQLVIYYADGTRQVVGTDDTWKVCTDGPIRKDDMFNGEYYDANYEQSNWSMPEFEEENSETWTNAKCHIVENEFEKKAVVDNGIKCIDTIQPVNMWEPVEGIYVYDFGQNFTGVCELDLSGKQGDTVTMRYAEYLNEEELYRKDDEVGTIWTRNLCTADNTDYYTFGEEEKVTYTPTFSYRGFQYLQIEGVKNPPSMEEVRAKVLATDNKRSGYFECSDEGMNRLYNAIYYSQLSNYVDVPTDCPQRDERLGWTGDAQVFAYTGSLNANTATFMYKYIDALRNSQNEDGSYPQIVPFVDKVGGANGWSDAGVIIVWEMYQQYGNKLVIEKNLQAMCKYVDYLIETSKDFVRDVQGYNDHNAISYMADECINTAQCAYVVRLLAKMCEVVEEKELTLHYREIYENYLRTWRNNYLQEDGSVGEWRQSEYVIPLAFQLYPEELEEAGAEKLNMSVKNGDYRVTTGFIATPYVLSVLCDYGYVESAYKLIQQKEYSSWNYMLEQGATALTERWNTIERNENNEIMINGSLNHVAFGAVGQWFYTDVLGIRRDENNPGYKHFYLEPQLGGGLTYARGSYESVYGKIESSWEVTEENIKFRFVVPANTSATLILPSEKYRGVELMSGTHEFVIEKE